MALLVLALDLERTLISDAGSAEPRPGLAEFLTFCIEHFERVVLFTTVEEPDARDALNQLAESGAIPAEVPGALGYVEWVGEYKDLAFVAGAAPEEVLLVDDDAGWIRPDQRDRWVPITPWDGGPDRELLHIQQVLLDRLDASD